MEELLKEQFDCKEVKSCNGKTGGINSDGGVYLLDGKKVFVKRNPAKGSRMYEGEHASLMTLYQIDIIKAPKPIRIFSRGEKSFFVMEYLAINPLLKQAASLGEKLAQLHLYNEQLRVLSLKNESFVGKTTHFVEKFGFDVTTCVGFIPMDNRWEDDWLTFYTRNRLKAQVDRVVSTYHDRDVASMWPEIERVLPQLFPSDQSIIPSLLHGDFWVGNTGEIDGEPCIFDPGSSYGHSEFDLALPPFPSEFHDAYHKIIPKQPGFEKRHKSYILFYLLNRWNHFGSGYKASALALMREICAYNK
ncbi:ketosamine-3-kinase-like isoform X2 [Clavelina lepadiformis]|uniref:ketosamine-3-kinase-like isoform X2 n=1 Tax=Clavelina lepadiformis TaxID=159417 RepID=UPI004041CE00